MKLKTIQFYLVLALLSNLLMPALSRAGSYNDLTDAQKDYWYKLLHAEYFKGKSRLDGSNFFLSPHGKDSPSLELTATIEAFKDPNKLAGWFNYPVQCVFRARFQFLKEVGFLKNIPETSCPMFDEWKKGLNADSATLVFSSSYPNNPSSLFGHTLIRLNQKNKTSDLLDYAVSFSAIPESDDIGIVFAFKGIFGGYRGLIEVTKYYTKVMEYSSSESRDLMEYELNLTPDELNRLIDHVWEIYQTTYADYYFLDENCSSFLADLLTVAMRDRDGLNDQTRWYYLPSELVRKLTSYEGVVKQFKLRPSLKRKLQRRLKSLDANEQKLLDQLIADKNLNLENYPTNVLDSAIEFYDYKKYRTSNDLTSLEREKIRKLLITRSKRSESSKEFDDYQAYNRPELGHDSKFMGIKYQNENSHNKLILSYRNGYHGLMDRDLGFDPFSEFNFFDFSLMYDQKLNRIGIDELKAVDLISLHPFKFYDPQFSWNTGGGYYRYYKKGCDNCHLFDAHAIGGLSSDLNGTRFNMMAGIFTEISSHLYQGFRVGPAAQLSYYINYNDKIKLGAIIEERMGITKNSKQQYRNILNLKSNYFIDRNKEINLEFKQFSRYDSLKKDSTTISVGYGSHF